MHLLYCDETNLEERAGDFLIYGGLVVEANEALRMSLEIDALRKRLKVPADYRFKFNPGPEGFSHGQFIELKEGLIDIVAASNAKLLTYLVLHDIATNPDEARRNGINTVSFHFHYVLNSVGGPGMVLIDRFNDKGNLIEVHLRDKFSIGITGLPHTPTLRLTNIVGFHYSTVGQSHFPSVVDVLLGSLRFAINAHTRGEQKNMAAAKLLLSKISPVFWRAKAGDPVPELGIYFSPKEVRLDRYRAKYSGLKGFLAENGIETHQDIVDPRDNVIF